MSPWSHLHRQQNQKQTSSAHQSTNQTIHAYGATCYVTKTNTSYLSTVSPLLRSGASIRKTVRYVFMPGTLQRTVVGGVFACAPWTQEFSRSVEHPRREGRPFQQVGNTHHPKKTTPEPKRCFGYSHNYQLGTVCT